MRCVPHAATSSFGGYSIRPELTSTYLDQFEDSPEGGLIFAAKAFMVEVEREKIVERTTRGKRARVQSGKLLAGPRPLYGYQWRDAEKAGYVVDPVTSPNVKRIFHSLMDGSALRQIARELTEERIPTPMGKSVWHPDVVRRILKHPSYAGNAYGWAWRNTERRALGFDEEYAIPLPEGTIPAIVDQDVWDAAQERLRYNQVHAPRRNQYPEDALMRCYVFCGVCSQKLYVERYKYNYKSTNTRQKKRSADEPILDYACRVKMPDGSGCRATQIRAKIIDDAVWGIVRQTLENPAIIEDELKRLYLEDPTEDDLLAVDRALQTVNRQQANITRAFSVLDNPDDAAPLAAQLRELGNRRRQLNQEREEILERHTGWLQAGDYLENLSEWCSVIASRIDNLSYEERRSLVALFGIHAKVYPKGSPERYVITARFSGETVPDNAIASLSSRG